MIIIADENIPFALEAFGPLGEVRRAPGRAISPELVRDADALIVRSVTRVNGELLAGSRVKFVGTATIGSDHVDAAWLARRGIAFASAPGCNAESVAQWVAAALCALTRRMGGGRPLRGLSLGVVGAGHCGSRVARVAAALGMSVRLCDPPLARAGGDSRLFCALGELTACDVVTLHVPLTRGAAETDHPADATEGMIGAEFIGAMPPGSALINACRGGVVDEAALKAALRSGALAAAAIDTWAGEPRPDPELIELAAVASPHVAGYSLEGKACGTEMISAALCAFLGRAPVWSAAEALGGAAEVVELSPDAPRPGSPDWDDFARGLIEPRVPLERDTAAMREWARASRGADAAERGAAFDRLRRDYPTRRELGAVRLIAHPNQIKSAERLARIGFGLMHANKEKTAAP